MPRTAWIIWGAMLAPLGIYAAFPLVWAPAAGHGAPFVEGVLAVMAIGCGVATFALRALLLRPGRDPAERPESRPRADVSPERLLQVSIVVWALCESVAVWGLVVFLLTGRAASLYAFVGAAAVLLAIHAPRSRRAGGRGSSAALARPGVRIG